MSDGPEVLIVGGGLVGASLALALDRAGVAATLVESRPAAAALADPERERYLALAAASVNALGALAVWPALAAHAQSIHAVQVSRQGDFGRLVLRADQHGVERFGAVVPASRLGQALAGALARCTRLTRLAPATLLGFQDGVDGLQARIDSGADAGPTAVRAQVLVGADGVDSAVRAYAGLAVEREDYGQDALVLAVGLGREHAGVAHERFTDEGAIALLPLPGRRAGLVWTLARDRADAIQSLAPAGRLAALQAAFGLRLGRFHSPGAVVRYPLQRSLAPTTVAGRVVLVGNAAQSLHPIAAQGFNLGLRDALTLAEELSEAGTLASGEARTRALDRHQQRRRLDRQRIAAASHALARWPKLRAPGLGLVRSAALAGLQLAGPVQRSLVLAAMGYGEDVPALGLEPAA